MRVDEVLPSKSGKAWRVRSGSQWYNAFGDSGIEAHTGKMIEADISTHEKYGAGISKYKVVESDKQPPPTTKADVSTVNWLPFASNVVAHCISAGIIKEPSQIKAWVFAAKNAAEGAGNGDVGF